MKILLTGANGFVATHFLKHLDSRDEVLLHVRNEARAEALRQKGWKVLIGTEGLKNLPHVEAIIHLAGKPQGNWQECVESNVLPTIEILSVIEQNKIPHLVFLSSGSVYGDTRDVVKEDAELKPISAYGASKVAAELIINNAIASKRIQNVTILRGNNIYGPGSDHGVVSLFIDHIQRGQPLVLDGDGSQIREPVFVDDVMVLIKLALAKPAEGSAIYNVSGPESFTLKELAEHIARTLGVLAQFKLSGKPASPPHTMRLDISKAERELGWQPKTTFLEGLRKNFESNIS